MMYRHTHPCSLKEEPGRHSARTDTHSPIGSLESSVSDTCSERGIESDIKADRTRKKKKKRERERDRERGICLAATPQAFTTFMLEKGKCDKNTTA